MRLPAVAAALLALLAGTAAGAAPRGVTSPGPVTALAADGARVAFTSGPAAGDCDRVRIWNLSTRAVLRLGRRTPCVETSTGTGIAALSIAGNRVLWLHYTGGNLREWRLFTATTSAPAPRQLAFLVRDADLRGPIVLGAGNAGRLGDILPYAVDRTVTALRVGGSRRFRWTAPARVVALSARGGELAVADAERRVTLLDAAGGVLREESYTGEIAAVTLTGSGVLVQRGRTLELRSRGALHARTRTIPAGARLVDAEGDQAVYVRGGAVHVLRMSDGREVAWASPHRTAHGQLEAAGLTIAAGRRVTLVPRTTVLQLLARERPR